MSLDTKLIVRLREMTGAGMVDAKNALDEVGGDLEKASELLRKRGVVKAAKKAARETKEGLVHAYIHSNSKVGALVEVLCETDFVARNEAFLELCHDIALHVSATNPLYIKREDIPTELIDKEKEIFIEEMKNEGKPDEVITKIIEGKLNKYFKEIVLLEQDFIKDETKTIQDLITEKISVIGENIQISRFQRFSIV